MSVATWLDTRDPLLPPVCNPLDYNTSLVPCMASVVALRLTRFGLPVTLPTPSAPKRVKANAVVRLAASAALITSS